MNTADALKSRHVPSLMTMNNGDRVTLENWEMRKAELIECLSENLYGRTPAAPHEVRVTLDKIDKANHWGGKAVTECRTISFDTPGGEYSFPFVMHVPSNVEKPPVILHIAFRKNYPDKYMPVEEIIDNGFALVHFCYQDVTPDKMFADFTSGLGGIYIGDRQRGKDEWGKVGMWAFGASRIMDYLVTRDDINAERVAVAGHSRLGKTALWCKAQDPRFFIAYGNDTNYGGAGLIREHIGEDVKDFIQCGSYDFFCERMKDFLDVPHEELPFDQHFLLACQAPGLVYVAGATKDKGMDPLSEFLSCVAASEAYKLFGKEGLVAGEQMPLPAHPLIEGEIGFHIRDGLHYFSRNDWQYFMEFFKKHM